MLGLVTVGETDAWAVRMAKPMKDPTSGEMSSITFSAPFDLSDWLHDGARNSGNGISAEIRSHLLRAKARQELVPETLALAFGEGFAGWLYLVGKLAPEVARARMRRIYLKASAVTPTPWWWLDPDGYQAALETMLRIGEEFRPQGALTFAPDDPECVKEVEAYVLGRVTPALAGEPYPDGQREFVEIARKLLGEHMIRQSRWLIEQETQDVEDAAARIEASLDPASDIASVQRAATAETGEQITLEEKIGAGRRLIGELVCTRDPRRRAHLQGLLRSMSKIETFPESVRKEFANAAMTEPPVATASEPPAPSPFLPPRDAPAVHPFWNAWLLSKAMTLGRTQREPTNEEIAETLKSDEALRFLAGLHHGPVTAASILEYRDWLIEHEKAMSMAPVAAPTTPNTGVEPGPIVAATTPSPRTARRRRSAPPP